MDWLIKRQRRVAFPLALVRDQSRRKEIQNWELRINPDRIVGVVSKAGTLYLLDGSHQAVHCCDQIPYSVDALLEVGLFLSR